MKKIQKHNVLLLILILSLFIRLIFFHGYGYSGDDVNYFANIYAKYQGYVEFTGGYDYRFTTWIPTLLFFKIFGINEFSWILLTLIFSIFSIILIYLIGKEIKNKRCGLISALLLAVSPYNVNFSTMHINDIALAFFMALSFLFFLKGRKNKHQLYFKLSGVAVFLGFFVKISVVYILLPFFIIFLVDIFKNQHKVNVLKKYSHFLLIFIILLSIFMTIDKIFLSGDFLGYYHAEERISGFYPLPPAYFKFIPGLLFGFNQESLFFFGLISFAAILAIVYLLAKKDKNAFPVILWLILVYMGLIFISGKLSLTKFFVGPLDWRYIGILEIPLILIVSYFITLLTKKSKKIIFLSLIILVLSSLFFTMQMGFLFNDVLDDMKVAKKTLQNLPEKNVYSDHYMLTYLGNFDKRLRKNRNLLGFKAISPSNNKILLNNIDEGYIITGGARDIFGYCLHCIPSAEDLPKEWDPLLELNKKSSLRRQEALRIYYFKNN